MILVVEQFFILTALVWYANIGVYGNQVTIVMLLFAISDVTIVCRWFSETRRIVYKPPLR